MKNFKILALLLCTSVTCGFRGAEESPLALENKIKEEVSVLSEAQGAQLISLYGPNADLIDQASVKIKVINARKLAQSMGKKINLKYDKNKLEESINIARTNFTQLIELLDKLLQQGVSNNQKNGIEEIKKIIDYQLTRSAKLLSILQHL